MIAPHPGIHAQAISVAAKLERAKAIKIDPARPAPHCNLGIALHELEKFEAALASFDVCECADLVVSVDTSVAHLSAANPAATLYRQPSKGDWGGVLARVQHVLRELGAGP